VVIGEGEKDDAPMLHNGEIVGTGGLEGTLLRALPMLTPWHRKVAMMYE